MTASPPRDRETFTCPWTGDDVDVHIPPHMSADEFCPTCDFPMFWSHAVDRRVKAVEREQRDANNAADDREHVSPSPPVEHHACPRCGADSLQQSRFCAQCGLNYYPVDKPDPAAAHDQRLPWSPWMSAVAFVLVAAVLLAILFMVA